MFPSNTSTVPGLSLSDMIPVLKTYFFHKRQNALLKSAELDKCLFALWFNITIKKFHQENMPVQYIPP